MLSSLKNVILSAIVAVLFPAAVAAQSIAFIQVNSAVPQTNQTAVSTTFNAVQTAGNLNLVVVGWNDTVSHVQSLVDTKGNAYALAVGPTVRNGFGTQAIYYAKNILAAAAGANTVTVTFDRAAKSVDLRIAEYRGLDTVSPLDVVVAATGSSTSTNSGSVTTRSTNELLVGANLVASLTTGAGTSYTQRIITNPDGDILEDRIVTAIGSYSATAPVSPAGAWVMQMVAFKAAAGGSPDTQAPTAPAGLAAVATSSSQINLSWTASSDNVAVTTYLIERCPGSSCTTFAQIATSPVPAFGDSGLSASTSYRYRVRATDAAGNVSAYSNTATTSTQATSDTEAPTTPANLTASVVSSSQVDLSWVASTDNVGLANYQIEQCTGVGCSTFAQIASSAATTFSNIGLAGSTAYSYRVRATDAAGNASGFSNVASVTTATAPVGITLVQHANKDAGTTTSSTLAFAASNSSGNWIGVAIRAGQTGQTISVSDTRGNTYRKAAQLNETADGTTLAFYYAESIAGGANTVTVSDTIAGGTLRFAISEYAGVAPANSLDVTATAQGSSTAPNSGSATTTASGDLIVGLVTTANAAAFTAGTGFGIQDSVPASPNAKLMVEDRRQPTPAAVSAGATLGAADSWGALLATFKPATGDTTAPTPPGNLVTTVISDGQVDLAWSAAIDDVGVTAYLVERCSGAGCSTFAQIASTSGLTFSNVGLLGSTTYIYRVRASDGAGNLGAYSNAASATTPASSDTQAPTPPSSLTAVTISSSRIDLSWPVSTDNVGVTGYLIEQCDGAGCSGFAQVGTSVAPAFSRTGLTNSTSYTFRVRATDAAGNLSAFSQPATATTSAASDTQPPTTPTALTATATSSGQIDLAWDASTDDVGVTAYLIERCQGAGCSNFLPIVSVPGPVYSDVGLPESTTYRYRVRAADAASNLSAYSNVATATTASPPDTQAPTAPTNPVAAAVTSSQINLTWTASTDNVGVANYQVERCQGVGCSTFAAIGTTTVPSFTNTGLSASTAYGYRIRAADAAGNLSAYSSSATATTPNDAVIAFVQSNYSAPQSSPTSVSVKFTAAQTAGNLNVVVVGWNSASGQVQSVVDTVGNAYVRAIGPTVRSGFATQSIYYAAGIAGAAANANTVVVTFSGATAFPDVRIAEYAGITSVNPVDGAVAAQGSGTSSNSGTVTTTNAADLLVGANIVSSGTTGAGTAFTKRVITVPDGDILEDRIVSSVGSYNATAPLTSGSWIMQMVAFRGGGAAPDAVPPTAPGGLAAAASSPQQIDLTWTASTDNVAVTAYRVERCQGAGCATFVEIGTVAGTATGFSDANLSPGTTYSYRVRAGDTAGNLGAYSNVSGATTLTPDVEPPSAPGELTATAVSGTRADLSWGPATDNVGVTGYRVEQCTGVGCTTFVKLATVSGTTFSATGLTPNTTYGYVVRATDAASLLGPYSNAASVTTLSTIPDLVAAYSFDEGSGTQAGDSSGTGNTGVVQNATWTAAGKYANALSFNGTSSLVSIADAASLDLTTAMTLEAWVYPSAVDSAWRDVIYKGNDNYFLEATTSSGSVPAAGATLGSTNSVAFGTTSIPRNAWTHLAETYDGTTLRLYVNGTQAASLARTGTIKTSTNPLQIGGDSIFGQFFQGVIDEVRIYRVALTPTQIQTDMGTPLGGSLPIASLSTVAIDFGNHSTGIASAPQSVTLTNSGGAPFSVSSVGVAGANPGDFVQTNDCVAVLPPSAACTITVTFTASAAGLRSATITIADNAAGAPHHVSLSGTGTGFSIVPRTAVVTPALTQQFSTTGTTNDVIWLVDDVEGGNSTVGTIGADGAYAPPASSGTHTVTVRTTDGLQSSSATVYVTTHAGVFTHHNDNARTGQNTNEIVLTPSNVSAATFGKLASFNLDGNSHASPLYVSNVTIPGQGVHNVVYVATEHNSVYAFDADGRSTTPLWHASFINPASGITTVPSGDTGECCDIAPEIGITGTPVIDPASKTLYVVAKTKEVSGGNTSYRQRLHALDLATGSEKFGGPVLIQASAPGNGGGSQGGNVPFDALRENQRPALLLNNGVVYIGFGSHGDIQPYHGWLLGYNATSLQQVFVHNSSPNSNGAGMWQANGGPAADAAGNIYFITGNGPFNANSGGKDYGDTFVKVNPAGAVIDYFTPHNQANIDANNFDLGAAGPLLLPDQPGAHPHLIVSAGKDNTIYLVDRDAMGHYNASNDNQIVQSLVNIFPFGTPEPGNYSSPVYFNGRVYFGPIADTIQAFSLTNGLLSTIPTSASPSTYSYPGAVLAVSANGNANGIVWAIQRNGDCGVQVTCGSAAPGVLRAYDATNLGVELYSSNQSGTRDALDFAAKFSVPLVVNGKVFVTTIGRLTIYGLLP